MASPAREAAPAPPRPPDRLPRPEKPKPKTPPHTSSGRPAMQPAPPLPTGGASGSPLPAGVAGPISSSLGVDVSGVRVHTDANAAEATTMLNARALAVGPHVMLGRGERATDLPLMAHEVAHVVQQRGAPRVQLWGRGPSDPYEREAHGAAAAVVARRSFTVTQRTTPRVQRLGLGDVLDWLADKANNIPGYRMFTVVIGVNPINGDKVERSGANILRAAVEFIPGGHLIVEALEKYGIFEKGGKWLEQQVATLGMTGQMFLDALKEFVHSLGISDLWHPGRVWDRAVAIFSRPIRQLIDFFVGLAVGILTLIKDAILKPLAKLAEGTPAWDLLLQVLGKNPITGEPVARSAEAMIGGFMKLIHQEELWQNIQRARAIPRAYQWFLGAIQGLLAFVSQVPTMFLDALRSLEIMDIVVLPRALVKVGKAFLGIAGRFLSWAFQQVLSLLQIVFEVVAPGAVPYIQKARGAFNSIIRNPIGFIGNLVRAGKLGFDNFRKNFVAHLRKAIIDWLTGSLEGVYIPKAFEFQEIVKFILSVLGISYAAIRAMFVQRIGEPVVKALETGFDLVVTLVRDGPGALWEKIKEQLSNLKDMLLEQILSFVKDTIVQVAIQKILSFLSPVGAFIQAIIGIYNTIMFFIERLRQIGRVVAGFIDSIASIAAGNIGTAAARVETTMAGMLSLVVSFLARFAGLGGIPAAIGKLIGGLRAMIRSALEKGVDWVVAMARRVGRFFAQAGTPRDPAQRLDQGLTAATAAVGALSGASVAAPLIRPVLAVVKLRYGFKTLEPVVVGNDWWVEGEINPRKSAKTSKKVAAGSTGPLTPMTPRVPVDFHCNTAKYALAEYQAQLDGQQAGLNQIPLDTWSERRKNYRDKGRPAEAAAAQEAARDLKREELKKEGKKPAEVERILATLAALHEPDLVAGGHYTTTKLGSRFINSSIGSQWRTRITVLDDAVSKINRSDLAKYLMNAKLTAKP